MPKENMLLFILILFVSVDPKQTRPEAAIPVKNNVRRWKQKNRRGGRSLMAAAIDLVSHVQFTFVWPFTTQFCLLVG